MKQPLGFIVASLFPAMGMIFCAEVVWKLIQSNIAVSAKESAIYAGWFLLEMLGFVWIIVKLFYLIYHNRSWDMLLGSRYLIMMVFGFVAATHFFEAKTIISDEFPADIFFLYVREALRESSLLLVFLSLAVSRPSSVMPNPILEKASFVFMGVGFIMLAYFQQASSVALHSRVIGPILLFLAGSAMIVSSLSGEMLESWNNIAEKGTRGMMRMYSIGKGLLVLSMIIYSPVLNEAISADLAIFFSCCFVASGGILISAALDAQEPEKASSSDVKPC